MVLRILLFLLVFLALLEGRCFFLFESPQVSIDTILRIPV